MPGSEAALEEPMCRIFGDLFYEGLVAKVADDLYYGTESPEELLHNWKRGLQALSKCSLGWIWNSGTLQASQHRIAIHSVLQQARNGWPSKVLYWCVQSSSPRLTPVLCLTSTTGHCRRRSPVLREDQLGWWNYKVPMDALPSLPHRHKTACASTPMTKTIPTCLQPCYHRYQQLLPHSHLNCTIPQKMHYLHPQHHRCLLVVLHSSFSSRYTDTNLKSSPSSCNQPGQDVLPKRPKRTRRTP